MKKSLIIFSVVAFALLGCSRKDSVSVKSPLISIRVENEVPVTALPGTTLEFSFSLTYKGGLKSAYAMVDGKIIEGTELNFNDAPESALIEFSYTPDGTFAGNTIDFAVHAEAVDGAKGHYDYPVFILAAKPDISIEIPEDAPEEFLVNGSTLSFDILIKSPSVDMMKVTSYKGDTVIPEMSFNVEGDDLRNVVLPFSYTPTLGDTGGKTSFSFDVMDVNGNIVSASYAVRFYKEGATELDEYTNVVLGLNRCTTECQFLDAVTCTKYKANGVGAACAEIDLIAFWSNNTGTQGLAFSAPGWESLTLVYNQATVVDILGGTTNDILANWSVRNLTEIRELELDADAYAAVSNRDDLVRVFNSGTVPSKTYVVYQKNVGSTIAFKVRRTADSATGELEKYGLLRVSARPATGNTGTITIDYKIEY